MDLNKGPTSKLGKNDSDFIPALLLLLMTKLLRSAQIWVNLYN